MDVLEASQNYFEFSSSFFSVGEVQYVEMITDNSGSSKVCFTTIDLYITTMIDELLKWAHLNLCLLSSLDGGR